MRGHVKRWQCKTLTQFNVGNESKCANEIHDPMG